MKHINKLKTPSPRGLPAYPSALSRRVTGGATGAGPQSPPKPLPSRRHRTVSDGGSLRWHRSRRSLVPPSPSFSFLPAESLLIQAAESSVQRQGSTPCCLPWLDPASQGPDLALDSACCVLRRWWTPAVPCSSSGCRQLSMGESLFGLWWDKTGVGCVLLWWWMLVAAPRPNLVAPRRRR
jgi:hypothetical protein